MSEDALSSKIRIDLPPFPEIHIAQVRNSCPRRGDTERIQKFFLLIYRNDDCMKKGERMEVKKKDIQVSSSDVSTGGGITTETGNTGERVGNLLSKLQACTFFTLGMFLKNPA